MIKEFINQDTATDVEEPIGTPEPETPETPEEAPAPVEPETPEEEE